MSRLFIFLLCLTFASTALYAKEQGKIECHDRHARVKRSTIFFTIDETTPKTTKITQKGKGEYDIYRNCSWETTSTLEKQNGILHPLNSERIIKNSDGKIIKTLRIKYNHAARVADFNVTAKNININRRFPIKGLSADGTNVLQVTASLVENHEPFFYLLTDMGNLYKINIRYLGTENATFRSKQTKVIRVRFSPSLGILDSFLENAIPASYAWYSTGNNCRWLRYEGKEVDRTSNDVVDFLGQ